MFEWKPVQIFFFRYGCFYHDITWHLVWKTLSSSTEILCLLLIWKVLVLFYTLSKSHEKLSLNLGVVCVWFVNIEYYNRISKRLLKQWGWRIKCSMRGKVVKIIKQRGFILQWQWLGKAYLISLLFSQVLLEMSILWMFVVFIWHPTRGSMRTRENKMQIIRNFGCTNCLSCLFSAKYKQNWHFKLEKCWNAKFLVHPTQEPGELILWPSVTAE